MGIVISFLNGHSNFPLVRGTSLRKIKTCIGTLESFGKGNTAKAQGTRVIAVGYFEA